jgi:glutamate racemase
MLAALKAQGATHFVSACNSMSVLTTSALLKECDIAEDRYIDMIRAFKEHATFPSGSQVLIAGTKATIASGEYQNFLKSKNLQAFTYTFPDLAKKIEEGEKETKLYAEIHESFVLAQFVGATHYVYACTHYPLIKDVFEKCAQEVSWHGTFVDPAVYVREAVKKWNLTGNGKVTFETSHETKVFAKYVRENSFQ